MEIVFSQNLLNILLVFASMLGVGFAVFSVYVIYRLKLLCEDGLYFLLNKLIGKEKYKRKERPLDTYTYRFKLWGSDARNFFRLDLFLIATGITLVLVFVIFLVV